MPEFDTSSNDIAINGRFLSQRLSGVQRYGREIVTALDRLVAADPEGLGRHRWRLIRPSGATDDLNLSAIESVAIGRLRGHAWEQYELARAARGQRLLNLCNSGPLLHRDSLVVIHDAAPYRTPRNFGTRYGAFHRTLGRLLAHTARLGTVSYFSRSELADVFKLDEARIFVAGNGSDHLIGRLRSPAIIDRLDLKGHRYFLFVGSPTPNKNLAVALQAFRELQRDDVRFVVAGSVDSSVFGGTTLTAMPGLVTVAGSSDAEIAALYASAAALVFPSRYEGFGIPPLEAMACGCPVLASDIPVLREVCGDAATYFPPDDATALSRLMADELDRAHARDGARDDKASARVAHYNWASAARALAAATLDRVR